ncbi:hypothetical protein [Sulfurimonas sp.]
MKRVLLIEDRYQRQEKFQEILGIDLENYEDVLDNAIYERYDEVYELLKNQIFDFSSYDVVVVHKSAFSDDNSKVTAYIERKCKEKSIILIYFSGGIDANFYQNEGDFELFEVNSKTLYSTNLTLFLEACRKDIVKPGMILYGEHWNINVLCNILSELNVYIEKILVKESIKEKGFYNRNSHLKDILFEMKDIELYKPKSINDEINKDEMKKLRDSIRCYIEKRLSHE